MNYEQPQVVVVPPAINQVQGACSKGYQYGDCGSARMLPTDGSAYEADE